MHLQVIPTDRSIVKSTDYSGAQEIKHKLRNTASYERQNQQAIGFTTERTSNAWRFLKRFTLQHNNYL